MSPRRYGKTSLALEVILSLKLPYAHIDFYPEIDETDIQKSILKGIGKTIGMIESMPQKALRLVSDFFDGVNTKVILEKSGLTIEFDKNTSQPQRSLSRSVERLDTLAASRKKKVILFLDEFQKLAEISKDHAIEGAIRHVAQRSKNIAFIFSGSNRHLLKSIFDDKTRPFYHLCDRIILEKIAAEYSLPFIKTAFYKKWQLSISTELINIILSLTERHPYYVNVLCLRLFKYDQLPSEKDIITEWKTYTVEEKSRVLLELDLLSLNQKKLLIALSKYGNEFSMMSNAFVKKTNMPLASIRQALHALEEKDFLHKNINNVYEIIDPLIKSTFLL